MKKIFYSLMLAALVVGASAFTHASEAMETAGTAQQTNNIYVFDGQTLQESTDPSKWILLDVNDDAPGCDSGDFPCFVETPMSIQDWLAGKTSQDVIDDASGLRFN